MIRLGSEFHCRLDVIQRNLPKAFGIILIVFLLLQLLGYISRFEIHLVEREDDSVLLEYEYVDNEGDEGNNGEAGLDYAALDNIAQQQAQYNYRYRYSMDNPKRNKSSLKAGNKEGGDNPQNAPKKIDRFPPPDRICSMRERIDHMQKYCSRDKTIDDTFEHKDLLVDEKHKLLYCSIPRVASTSFRTVMAKVTGNVPMNTSWPPVHNKVYMQGLGLKFLSQYDKPDANRIAREYYKVIVVRHPFDRLVSAWTDMLLVRNSPSRWKLGAAILAEYRDETHYETSVEWNDTARFHEFTQYLADKNMKNSQWDPYLTSCDVCMYKWDAILKLETLRDDSDKFLSKLPEYNGGLPFLHSHSEEQSELYKMEKRLRQFDKVSLKAIEHLKYTYEADMEIFGYDWNPDKNRTRCAIQTKTGELCC